MDDFDFDEILGDAVDDMLSSKTAFQLGTPTLTLPEASQPQLTYTPAPAAYAPEAYGPPLSAAPAAVQQAYSPAAQLAAAAAKMKGKSPAQVAAIAKGQPSFMTQPAFLGMNRGTVLITGGSILAVGLITALLVHHERNA